MTSIKKWRNRNMNTLDKAAREYAGIKPNVFIDSEER